MTTLQSFSLNGVSYTQVFQWSKSEGGNGNYYAVMITSANTLIDYENQANLNGGHLLTINSAEEQNFLESISPLLGTTPAILGASIINGNLTWTAGPEYGTLASYKNFYDQNPLTQLGPIFVTAADWGQFKWQSFGDVGINNTYNKNLIEFEENDLFPTSLSPDTPFFESVWTRLQQTSARETAYAVAVDQQNSSYVAGYTLGDLNGETNEGGADGFLAKYSPDGDLLWSHLLGGTGGDAVSAIGADKYNNIYALLGVSSGYSPDPVPAAGVSSPSYQLVKFDCNGTLVSSITINTELAGRGLCVTPDGDVLVTGSLGMWPGTYAAYLSSDYISSGGDASNGKFWESVNYFGGSNNFTDAILLNDSFCAGGRAGDQAYLAKYSTEGNIIWTHTISSSSYGQINAIAADSSNYVYVAGIAGEIQGAGYTPGSVIPNAESPTTLADRIQHGGPSADSFLGKFDLDGNLIWLKQFGTDGDDSADAVAIDIFGNIYVGGYTGRTYGNTAVIDTDALPYLRVFDSNGDVVWTKVFKESLGNVLSMSSDNQGFVYACGMAEGNINGTPASENSGRNSFLMKLSYLTGTNKNDKLVGSSGADEIYALDGNDTVMAGAGDDLIIGGSGAGNDIYLGGSGCDSIKYTSATAGIKVGLAAGKAAACNTAIKDAASIGTDRLYGIENIIGGNYDDFLIGSKFNNSINGENGNDRLCGGYGNDTLEGGLGDDRFVFNTTLSLANIDTISDFGEGADRIELSRFTFRALRGSVTADNLVTGTTDSLSTYTFDKNDFLVFNSETGILSYDVVVQT